MKKQYLVIIGFISIIGFCVTSAASRVLISESLITLDPFVLCFYTFTIGALFFITCNLKNLYRLQQKSSCNIKKIISLNITTTGSWLFLVYPLKFIHPSIVSTITFGSGPLVTIIMDKFFTKNKPNKIDVIVGTGIIIVLLYIVWLQIFIINNDIKLTHKIVSLCCCLVVGSSMVINRTQTKELINLNFSAFDMLTLRFILLIIISGIITFHKNMLQFNLLLNYNILNISLYFVVIPLFLSQIAQKYLEPISIAIVTPLMPIATFLVEIANNPLTYKKLIFVLPSIITMLIIILFGTISRYCSELNLLKNR